MAYKRYNRKRSVAKKPKSWYNQRYTLSATPMQVAQQALRATRYIKGLVNSEMLHKDTTFSAASITATGAITPLTDLGTGDTFQSRTGNSMLLRSLSYRYKIAINPAVTANTTVCVIIFQDTQQIGDTSPVVTDILNTANTFSLLSLSTSGRFKILSRKSYTLTPASGGKPAIENKGYHNLYSHVRYNGTATTDIQKNGLYVLFISSEATNTPTADGTFRIGYHDN